MEHKHGPKCGCKEYANVENASDLFEAIDLTGVYTTKLKENN